MLTSEIVRIEFTRISALVDNSQINIVGGSGFDKHRGYAIRVLADTIEKAGHLPHCSDYGWVIDAANEAHPYEVFLQAMVIGIIAEIPAEHPDLAGFKPVAVRLVRGTSFSSVSFPGEQVNFICISLGFMKFLQGLVGLMLDLQERGREQQGEHLFCTTNYVFGRSIEAALRNVSTSEIESFIKAFPDKDLFLSGYGSPITTRLTEKTTLNTSLLPQALMATEAFILCHEMGHLLRGHQLSWQRSPTLEREADKAAISLLLCASAMGEEYSLISWIGPPFFFQVARLYELIRRFIAATTDHAYQHGDALTPELELRARLRFVEQDLQEFVSQEVLNWQRTSSTNYQ